MAQTAVRTKKLADNLAKAFRKDGYKVRVTKVPKDTPYYKNGLRYYVNVIGMR